jgi:hypothetical protein
VESLLNRLTHKELLFLASGEGEIHDDLLARYPILEVVKEILNVYDQGFRSRGLASSSGKEANFIPPMLEQSLTSRTYTRDPTSPRLRRGRLHMLPYAETLSGKINEPSWQTSRSQDVQSFDEQPRNKFS